MKIAYLAPEIPALSATFVYEELLGLEKRGFEVVPISLHRPSSPAQGQTTLANSVYYLYELPKLTRMNHKPEKYTDFTLTTPAI